MKGFEFLIFFLIFSFKTYSAEDIHFGLGGESSGRAGSVTAEIQNPFAALYNPALISAQRTPQITLSTSFVKHQFNPLNGVLMDSPVYRTIDGKERVGSISVPSEDFSYWALGLTFPFRTSLLDRWVGLGLSFSGPFGKLGSFSSLSPYDFHSLHYGASNSKLKASFAMSTELIKESLYFGGAFNTYFSTAGQTEATLTSRNPTARMVMDVGLNSSAILGLLLNVEPFTSSFVYRAQVAPLFYQSFKEQTEIGGEPTIVFPATAIAYLLYEPKRLEWDFQTNIREFKFSTGLSYELWSQYEDSPLRVTAETTEGVRQTELPATSMRDTLNPRVSVSISLLREGLLVGSLGYQWRPSPVRSLDGVSNLLDSSTHLIGASLFYKLFNKYKYLYPLKIGLYGQTHLVSSRRIEKARSSFIGSPGYEYGGQVYLYGVSLIGEL